MSQVYEENPAEVERWLRRCDEVLALFDCALRGCRSRSPGVVRESLTESVRCLELASDDAAGRVLSLIDYCLAESEHGRFEEAAEVLGELKESWADAIAIIRRDRTRVSNLN